LQHTALAKRRRFHAKGRDHPRPLLDGGGEPYPYNPVTGTIGRQVSKQELYTILTGNPFAFKKMGYFMGEPSRFFRHS
jgi:hypothetical protein